MNDAAPERFRLLACYLAGRSIDVTDAKPVDHAYTDGQAVFVSANADHDHRRREVLVQAALLGAGSLDAHLVSRLRGRPGLARRYLALEGHRVLHCLATRLPLAAAAAPAGPPTTASSVESLDVARRSTSVPDPPDWFGVIAPARLSGPMAERRSRATDADLRLDLTRLYRPEPDDEDEPPERSRFLKLFDAPVPFSHALSDFLRRLFGGSRSASADSAGGELSVRSLRRSGAAGPWTRPAPTHIRFTDDDHPGATVGIGGTLHPEWDVHGNRYRPDWCRVIDYPLTTRADVAAARVAPDDVLRRRLSRIGLGPKALRRSVDGDDLDMEALVELAVDVRSGHSPSEHVHVERRKIARNLGVLILIDASGSATDADPQGLAVHDHQRRAAATIAATLEELGDRVAVYAFRSQGRHAVHLPAIKTFDQRFGAASRARLNQLQPSGYTRLGAGIRGAGEILKHDAGTPNRLLLVLSDGFPYDHGYEGRYAEADASRSLAELRADGVACLCLSLGAKAEGAGLERVFGSASHACAPTLATLSPRMDELFLGALAELAAPTYIKYLT